MASWVGKEGTESQSFWSSTRKAEGSKSGLMDIAWPNFENEKRDWKTMRGIVERQTALPTTRPVLLECHNEAKPILISSAQSCWEKKTRADKYRENAKRKEAGHETQVNHLLTKDLKETEKYHAKVNELKTKRKTGRDRKDNEKNLI